MQFKGSDHTFKSLRKKHPYLIYERLNIRRDQNFTEVTFSFNLSGDYIFKPSISFSNHDKLNEEELQNLAFHIGMVELISYWKSACPPRVIIKAASLSSRQLDWWKKLWFKGLGEFFYTNGIETTEDEFMEVSSESDRIFKPFNFDARKAVLVPIGGGKDSVVSLELLIAADIEIAPFIINPRAASLNTAKVAGFELDEIIKFKRSLDPELLNLNRQGYLNGHTPFSAMLAFVTLLAARLNGISDIALSNESSANEVTIPGTHINHQYSKSFEFESDFRTYVAEFISPDFNYFSFLRPLNELQIGKLFAGFTKHLQSFRSCNVGSKTDSWCGVCPKCLFIRIILSPFIGDEKMKLVFGKEVFDDESLVKILDELSGVADEKPFECVGTVEEVNGALQYIVSQKRSDNLPALLEHYKKRGTMNDSSIIALLLQFDEQNYLSERYENILKRAL